MSAPQLRLYSLLAVVLGFSAWALGLTWSVGILRAQVEEQVQWQIAAARWEREPGVREHEDRMRALVPAMRARLGTTPEARDTLDVVEASLSSHDAATQQRAASTLSPLIRRANAEVSIDLGSRWDQVSALVFLGLAFAFAAVLLQALRQRDQHALQTTERALSAAQDRLSRVGVGLLCVDDENHVHAPNEVAKGLAAAHPSLDAWWAGIDTAMRRPGSVPCQICGKPVPLGRCEVTDATRMGQRMVEVVFGGHAHDLEHGEKLVVLVRDITEQRRRQVLGGVADRLAGTRDLSRGISRAMTGRTTRLVRALRGLARLHDDVDLIEVSELAEELRDLGRSMALFATDTSGPSDVTDSCWAAARLVRPQLSPQVRLQVEVPDGLRAHTRPSSFTHALFTELLRAAEACADGADHKVVLSARREGGHIVVEIRDDRDPESPRSRTAPISATQELFQAAGATLARRGTLDRHVASIRVQATS